MTSVSVVIVTFNRRVLLERCLDAVATQTRRPDRIVVVDNASTDGTLAWLRKRIPLALPQTDLVALDKNTGGAGGFSEGLRRACLRETDWIWMMDDDAAPHSPALEELMKVATDPGCIYASAAVCEDSTSWTTTLIGPPVRVVSDPAHLPACVEVESLPFLGFLIHRDLVQRLGLPDAGYFIAADDIEYCLRARRAGARLYIAGLSRIEHPKTTTRTLRILGREIIYLSLAPWKRYYDTRNRLLNARRYTPVKLFTNVLPGTFVRLVAALWSEPRKLAQLRAFAAGTMDGLLGRKGKLHEWWGIS